MQEPCVYPLSLVVRMSDCLDIVSVTKYLRHRNQQDRHEARKG